MTEEPDSSSGGTEGRRLASKIGFLLVDKLVFGLLIVLAGFMLNSILERNRAETAFENEIAKVRVEKVAAVWGVLDTQQLLTDELPRVFVRGDCTGRGLRRFEQIRRTLNQGNIRFQRLLATNRFWLGDELFAELQAYAQRQSSLGALLWRLREQRQALARSVLSNIAHMAYEKARARGRQPVSLLPTSLPTTRREFETLKRLVAREKILPAKSANLLDRLLCAPALTPTENRLLGELTRKLEAGRQDVAEVTENFGS